MQIGNANLHHERTGLGCTVIKEIAEAHCRSIDTDSKINKYSKLVISLPTKKEREKMGKKILVVDDAENIRYLLKTILELQDYDVTTCESGKKALRLMQQDKPSLLILDLMMPEMDGWEVMKQMRAKGIKVPTLVLTARVDDSSKQLTEEKYRAAGFITKPFLNEDLLKAVNKILK